jgi:hypothetical protein
MIDIKKISSAPSQQDSKLPVMLFAALCFVVWDSGYYKKWFPSQDRDQQVSDVSAALLIKSPEMTVDQQYTASSPVLDEIADQRGIKFRVIDDAPGEVSGAPEWIQELFLKYETNSPCLAVVDVDGKSKYLQAPSSVSDFRRKIGAK